MIPLINVDEVKSGRGGGKRSTGKKYGKYELKSSTIEYFKESIARNKDGIIRIKAQDIADELGLRIRDGCGPGTNTGSGTIHPRSFYWGIRYTAWFKGLVVGTGQMKDGSPILTFRLKTVDDDLPPSLAKGVQKELEETDKEIDKEEVNDNADKEDE